MNEEERTGIPTRQAETADESLPSPGRAQNSIYYENVTKEWVLEIHSSSLNFGNPFTYKKKNLDYISSTILQGSKI